MASVFLVGDDFDKFQYEVRVYPNRQAYLRACRRRAPQDKKHNTSEATTFHESRYRQTPGGRWVRSSPVIGAIYLHRDRLDAEIVTHEATHAALNLWRQRHRGAANLRRNQTTAEAKLEEPFALSVGRLSQAIGDKLWDVGAWARPVRRRKRVRSVG